MHDPAPIHPPRVGQLPRDLPAGTVESELLLFLSQSSDAFVMYDDALRYTYINQAGASFLGLTPEEIIGKTNEDLIGPEAASIEKYVQAAFDGEEKVFVVHEVPLPTGTLWFDTIYTPVFDQAKNIVRVVGVCRDVTDNKMKVEQLENLVNERTEGLRQSEGRYRDLIETTAAVAWEVDLASLRFTFMSPQIATLSGHRPEDWTDFAFWAAQLHPEDRDQAVNYCKTATEKGLDHSLEYRMIVFGGKSIWVRDCVTVIMEGGKPKALRGIFLDITEHKLAEQERQKLDAQLQHSQKLESLGVLAGGIAHDFNNILMTIIANADLALLDLPSDDQSSTLVQEILTAGQHAAALTNQMLAYSGRGRFYVEILDVNTIIRDMSSLLESSATKRLGLRFDLGNDLPTIEADAAQLRQIVLNLVTNAAEAMADEGDEVIIRTCAREYDSQWSEVDATSPLRRGDTCVVLEVSDSGCGMDDETVARIFEPFFTTKFTGRGLGLAAVQGIVRGHGGAISVQSEPGRGTTFTVLFPASVDGRMSRPSRGGRDGHLAGGTILLVDDDSGVRGVTLRLLERLGYCVLAAKDGPEALEVFERHQEEITCVLLDLTMPRMDGEATFAALRKIRSDAAVVLSSGYSEVELEERFGDTGIAGFIQKPYDLESLRMKLARVLG